jgi:transposase
MRERPSGKAIRIAGVSLIFLLKYSLDPNSIEQFFSKPKHYLREVQARTRDAVCDAIAATLITVCSRNA